MHKNLFTLTTLLFIAFKSYAILPDTSSAKEISILTYNIKMLPRGATFLHHHPVKRARLIPAKLIEANADVIVFQEAFDGLAMHIIKKKMKAAYPYNAGWKNKLGFTFFRAGGVLMLSKYPIKALESITYKKGVGIDKIARKGAMLVEVNHPAKKFQLLGTHMQAGGGKELKLSQYKEAGELLKRYTVQGVPQFASGDFNCKKDNPELYVPLVTSLECENGEICGELKYTSDHLLNDMDTYQPDKRHVIDYVFFKANGVQPISQSRTVKRFQEQWDKKHKDLSDHFAVELKMTF